MLAALLALPAHATLTGNQLLSRIEGSKNATSAGTVDYAFVAAYVSGVFDVLVTTEKICPPNGFSFQQSVAMAEAFLLRAPASRQDQAVFFVIVPLMKNFPCPAEDNSK